MVKIIMYPTKNVNDSTQVNGEPRSVEVDRAMLGRALGDAFRSRLRGAAAAAGCRGARRRHRWVDAIATFAAMAPGL